jgi:hypothetical protein
VRARRATQSPRAPSAPRRCAGRVDR